MDALSSALLALVLALLEPVAAGAQSTWVKDPAIQQRQHQGEQRWAQGVHAVSTRRCAPALVSAADRAGRFMRDR